MELIQQVQSVAFSLLYSIIVMLFYSVISRFFFVFRKGIINVAFTTFFGIVFGFTYYYLLVMINGGTIRFYYFISLVAGYIVFENYYALEVLQVSERIMVSFKKLISPIYFIFKRIHDTINKIKKVIWWQRKRKKED